MSNFLKAQISGKAGLIYFWSGMCSLPICQHLHNKFGLVWTRDHGATNGYKMYFVNILTLCAHDQFLGPHKTLPCMCLDIPLYSWQYLTLKLFWSIVFLIIYFHWYRQPWNILTVENYRALKGNYIDVSMYSMKYVHAVYYKNYLLLEVAQVDLLVQTLRMILWTFWNNNMWLKISLNVTLKCIELHNLQWW